MTPPIADRRLCPGCGAHELVAVVYGYPSPDLEADALAGKLMLGGCVVGDDDPEFHCWSCGRDWRSDDLPGTRQVSRPLA